MPTGVYKHKRPRSDESYLKEIRWLKTLREEVRDKMKELSKSLNKLTRDINKLESSLSARRKKDSMEARCVE